MALQDDPSILPFRASGIWTHIRELPALQLLLGCGAIALGLILSWPLLAVVASLVTFALAIARVVPSIWARVSSQIEDESTVQTMALVGMLTAAVGLSVALGWWDPLISIYKSGNWDAIGAIGEGVVGAFGQILVALVALIIAWRQFVVDQRLTTQQNRITQAQTIDSFIQGISDLISDEEGMLEDWPLERMLAEGRLAAVFGSIDKEGRARVLRFLAHARLLTPLRRDQRLGRAILDGQGNYEEDRVHGVPVIQLQLILRGVDLSGTDLRGVDFNGADLRGCDLAGSDLSGANLAGTNLAGANLEQAKLEGTRFFYGRAQTATPRRPELPTDLHSGGGSGAVVENANFSGCQRLDAQTHHYLACWSGNRSRSTLPGGCKGIPNQLEPRPQRHQGLPPASDP